MSDLANKVLLKNSVQNFKPQLFTAFESFVVLPFSKQKFFYPENLKKPC